MVRRRCRFIVVSDASCDPSFSLDDLGNSIRKIRTDLGIPIYMDDVHFETRNETSNTSAYCAIGKIDYAARDGGEAPLGTLLYIKASLGENLSVDVFNYAKSSKDFSHEPTSDQWFSESQFESYRRLGEEAIEVISQRRHFKRSWESDFVSPVRDNLVEFEIFMRNAESHLRHYVQNGQNGKQQPA